MKRESPSRCERCASCEGGGSSAGDWIAVGVPRYRYLRNPQCLLPRKDALSLWGSKQPAQLPSALPIYIHHYLACPCWYKPVIATGKPVREGSWREICTV